MVVVGFLLAEIQLRQRTMEFFLCQLVYGRNLLSVEARCTDRTHAVSPLDILDAEVAVLDRYGDLSAQLLLCVEPHLFWTVDPISISWPPLLSILPSASAIQCIREHRSSADPELLWIFTDGLVDGIRYGATAVLFPGSSTAGHPFSVRFEGLHSSTQAKLVALHFGCQKASGPWTLLPPHHCVGLPACSSGYPAFPRHWCLGTPAPSGLVQFAVHWRRPSALVDPSPC